MGGVLWLLGGVRYSERVAYFTVTLCTVVRFIGYCTVSTIVNNCLSLAIVNLYLYTIEFGLSFIFRLICILAISTSFSFVLIPYHMQILECVAVNLTILYALLAYSNIKQKDFNNVYVRASP